MSGVAEGIEGKVGDKVGIAAASSEAALKHGRGSSSSSKERNRKKKLVRTKRVSRTDSNCEEDENNSADGENHGESDKNGIKIATVRSSRNRSKNKKNSDKSSVKFARSVSRGRTASNGDSLKQLNSNNVKVKDENKISRNNAHSNKKDIKDSPLYHLLEDVEDHSTHCSRHKSIKSIIKTFPWKKTVPENINNSNKNHDDQEQKGLEGGRGDPLPLSSSTTTIFTDMDNNFQKHPQQHASSSNSRLTSFKDGLASKKTTSNFNRIRPPHKEGPSCNHIPIYAGNGNVKGIQDCPATAGIIGLESSRSRDVVERSSLLVDMGKVVGVLKSSPPVDQSDHDDEVEDLPFADDSAATGCSTCTREIQDAIDDSLCGDPLMYATFVAPIQQYSTETESSRQPSFNISSRTPSMKQNSSEAPSAEVASANQDQQCLIPFPALPPKLEPTYSNQVQDIYEQVPLEHWSIPPNIPPHHPVTTNENVMSADCIEYTQADLNQQVTQERLSFLSVSSNNEEDEESVSFPPLPPLPPSPTPPLSDHTQSHWDSGEEESDNYSTIDTINSNKRRARRERNKSAIFVDKQASSALKQQKSRSKSCSPGREIEASSTPSAIVILSQRSTRSFSQRDSRTNTPENVSESSISFHENELQHKPQHQGLRGVCDISRPHSSIGGGADQHRKVPRVCEHPREGDAPFMSIFANRNSVRESWISSGSDYHGSMASAGGGGGSSLHHINVCSTPGVVECSVPSDPYVQHDRPSSRRSLSNTLQQKLWR